MAWPPSHWQIPGMPGPPPVDPALADPYGNGGVPLAPPPVPGGASPVVAAPGAPLGVAYDWPAWSEEELAAGGAPAPEPEAAPAPEPRSAQRAPTPTALEGLTPGERPAPEPGPLEPVEADRDLIFDAGEPVAKSGKNAPAPGAPPPTIEDRYEQGVATAKDIELRKGIIEAGRAGEEAEWAKRQAERAQELDDFNRIKEVRRQKDLDKRFEQLQADRVALANEKIDRDKWFQDQGTAGQLAWAVSAFIGGMLAVSTGSGKNNALDLMERMIDRDLETQKANLAAKRQAFGDSVSLYQELRQKYGDERTADAQYKTIVMDQMAMQAKAEAMKWGTPRALLLAEEGANAIDMRNTDRLQEGARYSQEFAFKKEQADREYGLSRENTKIAWYNAGTSRMNAQTSRLSLEEQIKAREQAAKQAMAQMTMDQQGKVLLDPSGKPITDSTGRIAMAPDPKVAFEERQKQAAGWAYYEELQRYRDYTAKIGRQYKGDFAGISGNSDELARAETMHKSLMMKYKTAEHLGALDKGAIEVFNAVVQPPSSWTKGSNPMASADEAARVFKDTKNTEMRTVYGYQGNWVDEYEKQVPFKAGDTNAEGNRQGQKFEVVMFIDDDGTPNYEGRGRTATLEEVEWWADRKSKAGRDRAQAANVANQKAAMRPVERMQSWTDSLTPEERAIMSKPRAALNAREAAIYDRLTKQRPR